MTGHEHAAEEELFLVARAAMRVSASHGIGFHALRAMDVTVAHSVDGVSRVVLVARDQAWSATATFVSGSLSGLSVWLRVRGKDPINGLT